MIAILPIHFTRILYLELHTTQYTVMSLTCTTRWVVFWFIIITCYFLQIYILFDAFLIPTEESSGNRWPYRNNTVCWGSCRTNHISSHTITVAVIVEWALSSTFKYWVADIHYYCCGYCAFGSHLRRISWGLCSHESTILRNCESNCTNSRLTLSYVRYIYDTDNFWTW